MKPCRCHADPSLYGSLVACPACRHRSYDPGVGCERRACGHVGPLPGEQLALAVES